MQPCPLQITRGEILNYKQQIEEFAKRFYREGPGSIGDDLDKGKNVHVGLPEVAEYVLLKDVMGLWNGAVVLNLAWTLGSPEDPDKPGDSWRPDPNSLILLLWGWGVIQMPRLLKLSWESNVQPKLSHLEG